MPQEIERKFLVASDDWRRDARGEAFRQGFLSTDPDRTVRVRVKGGRGYLTVKGRSVGASRAEYEYTIPREHADEMLTTLCKRPLIEKTRYLVPYRGHTWEVDEFHGENEGLVVAELELGSEQEAFEAPPWLGAEVTGDPRYFNSRLAEKPFRSW